MPVTIVNMKTRKRTKIDKEDLLCDFCEEPKTLLLHKSGNPFRICADCIKGAQTLIKED